MLQDSSQAQTTTASKASPSWTTALWHSLSAWLPFQHKQPNYPRKTNRYYPWGWNRNYQYCYTKNEIELLQQIQNKHAELISEKKNTPFDLVTEKRLYDWWVCFKPHYTTFDMKGFTLPDREAKDANIFPLWYYAENIAKQIANWQAERVKQQKTDLMNDPTMLVLEELKNWFYHSLIMSGCQNDSIEQIAKRQSYIKQLLHLLPSFGLDRLYLYETQERLNEASTILANCISNKQLPDLLSDTIIKSRSLENTIGSFLHFLLVNEEVSDNFSSEFMEKKPSNCQLSPVCKAYQNAQTDQAISQEHGLHTEFNRFYNLLQADGVQSAHLTIKNHVLDGIHFAPFFNEKDKQQYLESLALLDSLTQIRKTLEHFRKIQNNLGNYLFASHYLKTTDELTQHYLSLIDRIHTTMNELLNSEDQALKAILQNKNDATPTQHFEKNLQILETLFAKETTPKKMLELYCDKLKNSIKNYQLELQKLATRMHSGEAEREVNEEMKKLFAQLKQVNALLSAQLNKNPVVLFEEDAKDPSRLCLVADTEKTQVLNPPRAFSQTDARLDEMQLEQCPVSPSTLTERIAAAALSSGLHGGLRGAISGFNTTLIDHGCQNSTARFVSQLSYYSCLFVGYFYSAYQAHPQTNENDLLTPFYKAAFTTGQLWIVNFILGNLGRLFANGNAALENNNYNVLSKALHYGSKLTRFGVFAYNASQQGLPETAAALVAGTTAELSVEKAIQIARRGNAS